jgi:predicted RNA-binding Zn-ribbon protein involved in translation (DUF1610 family)
MTKSIVDDQPLSIPCPNCGHKITKTIGWCRGNGKLACAECDFIACLDTRQVQQELAKVDQALSDFIQAFAQLANQ